MSVKVTVLNQGNLNALNPEILDRTVAALDRRLKVTAELEVSPHPTRTVCTDDASGLTFDNFFKV